MTKKEREKEIDRLEKRLIKLKNENMEERCTCKGHEHSGGAGGCYWGGRLGLPRCGCTARE